MKKGLMVIVCIFIISSIVSCRSVFRDYQDDQLEDLALMEYEFDSYSIFKIVDTETSKMLTGKTYQNSGVVIGKIKGEYKLLFVPKKVSEDPFFVGEDIYFDLNGIYTELASHNINSMFLQDYGSLVLTVTPYAEILAVNQGLVFDSSLFFVVSTDNQTFYCNYVSGSLVIYDMNYKLLK